MQLTRPLVLASNSPRRWQLLRELDIPFRVEVRSTDETYPSDLPIADVPAFLAHQKTTQFQADLGNQLVLCADTIVVVDQDVLNKPADLEQARQMLHQLAGRTHRVLTGVCLLSAEECITLTDEATVMFRSLDDSEIRYYLDRYQPLDKAGAYGVQEWIGLIGIERIEGSFYTIMGLPIHRVYELLKKHLVATESSDV